MAGYHFFSKTIPPGIETLTKPPKDDWLVRFGIAEKTASILVRLSYTDSMINPFFANKLEQAVKVTGCPLCFMRQQAESKYIHSIIADHINDPASRVHIINSLGYCPTHTWKIAEVEKKEDGESLGTSIIYEHLALVIRERLEKLKKYPKTLTKNNPLLKQVQKYLPQQASPSASLRTETACRVCVMAAESDDSYVRWLLEGLSDPDNDETRRLYRQSNRLCFDHLRQSLDKAVPASAAGLEFLLEDSLEMLKALDGDLRVHISKYDYDKKAPRTEAEQFSWLRAVYFFAGRREGENPKPGFSDRQES